MVVCSDLTEQIAARAEAPQHRDALAHVARVSSLGELTATLAHELNQPLAAILSDAQTAIRLLNRDRPDVPQVRKVLRDIVADDRLASAIIQRLRDMMRRGPAARERVDLCQVVREVREIMRNGLSTRGITVVPDFVADLPAVVGDRIQIQQVVVNLVTNAMQAMDGQTEARLTLGVRGRDDGWQVVSVADTGPGIAASALDSMFEPFTSSRPGWLGMGLSISRSIIEAHGARSGARTGQTVVPSSVSDCRLKGSPVHDDGLTVFVVDDDRSVRRSVVRLLETAGLRVEGFVSAEAFLARERSDGSGCLVLDVRMSGMSGLDLQRRLLAAGRWRSCSSPGTATCR